jgi:hypothetical protein
VAWSGCCLLQHLSISDAQCASPILSIRTSRWITMPVAPSKGLRLDRPSSIIMRSSQDAIDIMAGDGGNWRIESQGLSHDWMASGWPSQIQKRWVVHLFAWLRSAPCADLHSSMCRRSPGEWYGRWMRNDWIFTRK